MAVSLTTTHPDSLDATTREAIYRSTYEDLPTFIDLIFSHSMDEFTRGGWVLERGKFLQSSRRTNFVGPRRHFKSTGFYSHWMWQLWRARFNSRDDCPWAEGKAELEGHYFSYKTKSAGYHIGQAKDSIKDLIARNPWFGAITDEKPTAETKGVWTWDGQHSHSLDPHGMLSHTRGINADIIYVDDPFQDPENDLNPTQVLKINNVFKSNIIEIPVPEHGDHLHVATTPQTEEDFTFDTDLMEDFEHWVQPAIRGHQSQETIWPERYDYQALMQKKSEIGSKLFNQEFMCSPKSTEVAFFQDQEVGQMVEPGLTDWGEDAALSHGTWQGWRNITGTVGGIDIGKKRHPAHLAVFAVFPRWLPDKNGKLKRRKAGHLVQVHSKWMDGWDYSRQVDYCRQCINYFDIRALAYDNTRGEYEGLDEMGEVPRQMEPVTLSSKTKSEMAGYMDPLAQGGRLKLLNDGRQNRQLTVVTNDLQAVETSEGHGESFFSIGLAVMQSQNQSWGSSFGTLEM